MWYLAIKFLISALLLVAVAEAAKRSALFGSILASIPLISVLAMIWLYIDTKNVQAVALLSRDIFWLVIPSLLLFICLPILLRFKMNFYSALCLSIAITIIGYFLMIVLLKKFGIKIS